MATREIFWGLSSSAISLFYALATLAVVAFLIGALRHILKYRRGRPLSMSLDWRRGLRRLLVDLASHSMLRRRDQYAGFAHALILFGFLILFVATSIITLQYDIVEPLTGHRFWTGAFFKLFEITVDLGGFALIVGLVAMMIRRGVRPPAKLDYRRAYRGETSLRPAAQAWRREDWLFLLALLLIAVTGFFQEALRLITEKPPWAWWSPVGNSLAQLLQAAGLSVEQAVAIRRWHWWFHGAISLGFIGALPWYKAKHIIAAIGSLAARDPDALRRLPASPAGSPVGIATLADLSWKDMLHLDACTKCGRCHEACPARDSGYPLSPRDLILDLRLHNNRTQGRASEDVEFFGDPVDAEAVWACRTCGACQNICPVGIEHPPLIVQLRRALVERGKLDPRLQKTLSAIADTGNSFGESPRRRGDWSKSLPFKIKDCRAERTEILWYVGDFASFDPRNQIVNRTVARLLQVAGLDFGILYSGEKTAGNDVRRIGEEGLFESLAAENHANIRATGCRQIVTTDPHTYNTLKNEYPQFGDMPPVRHYSAVLRDLLSSGALKRVKPIAKRVTLHDPCHLGRLNNEYEAPRDVLRMIGCELVEMPRCRENSFCCGAGGGRIWIPDPPGTSKPSESRMQEAAGLNVDYFVTCCPKDLTMYEDARKTGGHEGDLEIIDLAELVAEATDVLALCPDDGGTAAFDGVLAVAQPEPSLPIEPIVASSVIEFGRRDAPSAPTRQADAPAREESAVTAEWTAGATQPLQMLDYDRPAKTGGRLLVAVKHVGVLNADFTIPEGATTLDPAHFDFRMNETDDCALEMALLLAQERDVEVVAVTVGPENSDDSLRKALAKGAHRGVRIWNEALGQGDPLMIAQAIAGVALREQPDLILTGVQSSDVANGATAGFVAGLLRWPTVAVAVDCQWCEANHVKVTRELLGGLRETIDLTYPAVLSVQSGANIPRHATMRMIKEARRKPLTVLGDDLLGMRSSRQVDGLAPPSVNRATMLEGDADTVAAAIAELIRQARR